MRQLEILITNPQYSRDDPLGQRGIITFLVDGDWKEKNEVHITDTLNPTRINNILDRTRERWLFLEHMDALYDKIVENYTGTDQEDAQ